MNARELFGVLVRWTGLMCMAWAVGSSMPFVTGAIFFIAGGALLLFADAVVTLAYAPRHIPWPQKSAFKQSDATER